MNKIVLITGATSGIGHATARKFAENNYDLIITGRRKERLEKLKKELLENNKKIRVLPLAFDVRSLSEVVENLGNLDRDWQNIDILVNNAGLAVGLSHIDDGVIDDWERMIDTNIKGLLYITRVVSPGMVERGRGHILNIGSIAGKEVYENGNVYCATKHAVDALSRSMRIDLVKHGIKVSNIAPGLVKTEFSDVRFKGDKEKAEVPYKGMKPLSGEDIADVILYCVSLPDHVNINDVLIMPTAQASATIVNRD
ncbi:MAG: SDR family NAD(P)-dependent oxidoreductase [Bacteroidales bacterium]|nr:SDR family NAD(P)-dependent oxidoreductase [Bacteroidales bacterium]